MQVVAHDGVGVNSYGEARAEKVKAFLDPRFSMLEGLAGITVDTAEKSAPHASLHAVIATVAAGRNQVRTGCGHVASMTNGALWRVRTVPGAVSEESELWVS
jgi:hypothetical protein